MQQRRYHVLKPFSDHNGRFWKEGSIYEITLVQDDRYEDNAKRLNHDIQAYLDSGVLEPEALKLLRDFDRYGPKKIILHSNAPTDLYRQLVKAGKSLNITVTRESQGRVKAAVDKVTGKS